MELVTPGLGLMFWQILLFLPLLVIAWIMVLVTDRLEATAKIVWLIGTLFLPIIGPPAFFIKFPSLKKAKPSAPLPPV